MLVKLCCSSLSLFELFFKPQKSQLLNPISSCVSFLNRLSMDIFYSHFTVRQQRFRHTTVVHIILKPILLSICELYLFIIYTRSSLEIKFLIPKAR